MTFEEIGAALRQEREKRNLDIDDVANQLKISPRQLRALEEGNVGSLPHPAYVRGFIRSYASWLGIAVTEINDALNDARPAPVSLEAPAREEYISEPEGKSGGNGKGLLVLCFVCILCAGAYFFGQAGYFSFLNQKDPASDDMTAQTQDADAYISAKDRAEMQNKNSQSGSEDVENTDSGSPGGLLPLAESGNATTVISPIVANAPQKHTEVKTPGADAPKVEASASANSGGSGARAGLAGQHKLIITAIEECWVHSSADNTDTRQFSLRKGDTFALAFSSSLELKLGNAGGVRLRYDGKDMPPPGTSGQVRTLSFPPEAGAAQ